MSKMSEAEREYRDAVNRAKAPGPNPKLGDKAGLCPWRLCARHARRALAHLLAGRTALSARHGARTARYALALAPVVVAFVVVLALAGAGAPVLAQDTPPTFEPTPGLVDEPPILAPVARSSELYLPAIMAPVRTTIGEPLPPVTPTPAPVAITPVPTSTPPVTPTATPEPTGTPFLVTPTAALVDVPLFEYSNAAVNGVWAHAAVCNHTWSDALATVGVTATMRTGAVESYTWPDSPATVPSGDCVHLYAILPASGAWTHAEAALIGD